MEGFIQQFRIFVQSSFGREQRDDLFQSIWEEYHQKLVVFLQMKIKDALHAEDMAQEIMLKVYQKLHTYNPLYSFTAWFYSIARHHCIDYFRQLLPEKEMNCEEEEHFRENIMTPENTIAYDEIHAIIESYIHRLDDADREISFLRFYENLNYKKIGSIINMPAGTVKYRVHTIRAGLQKVLEEYDEE